MFQTVVKLWTQDKVELKKVNNFPLILLDNIFSIDKESSKPIDR